MEKETLEEAAEKYAENKSSAKVFQEAHIIDFKAGADWFKHQYTKDAIRSFPDNIEIRKWWQTQKFQKEQGDQEYTMIYEIDLPKILKAFTEHFKLL